MPSADPEGRGGSAPVERSAGAAAVRAAMVAIIREYICAGGLDHYAMPMHLGEANLEDWLRNWFMGIG